MLRASLPFDMEGTGVAKILLSGQLPDVVWADIEEPTRNLIRQCLTVNMQDRPPAMELLMHPAFRDSSSRSGASPEEPSYRRTASSNSPQRGPVLRHNDEGLKDLFAMLPACGLLSVRLRF